MQSAVRKALAYEDVWAQFIINLKSPSNTTILDIKREKLLLGSTWEEFCRLYLLNEGYTVYMLAETPSEVLSSLGLRRNDVGIDIIAFNSAGCPCAVQCKFRTRGVVSWRELSTFEALCARSGPWKSHIVMTNAASVRREGRSTKDATFAQRRFASLDRVFWMRIIGAGQGRTVGGNASPNTAREQFLSRFQNADEQCESDHKSEITNTKPLILPTRPRDVRADTVIATD